MKKIKIFAMLISLACATGFVACDDDEAVKQALQTPSVSDTFSDYQSLDFKWDAVSNTTQYGYKLYDPDEAVVEAGVTKETAVSFTGLQPATTYKLLVWAFAGLDTDYSTSPAAELTATTAALKKLSTPSNLVVADNIATWDAVEDAESYSYTISAVEGGIVTSGVVTSPSVKISGLEEGDYSFTVVAKTSQGGYIPESEAATVTFTFKAVAPAYLWKATGTYYSAILDKSWEATLYAYADGSYSIPAFYGVEGYDLDFKVENNGTLNILSGKSDYDRYSAVSTGNASVGDIHVYVADSSYSGFYGDSSEGELWLSYYDSEWLEGYECDTFTWTGSTSGGSTSLTIDDLVGTYTNHLTGWSYLENSDYTEEEIDYDDFTATIKKIDDSTISLDGIYWTETPITGTVDMTTMTITFLPQDYYGYTFAGYTESDPVVATINADKTININDFGIWWSGTWYVYGYATLTPQNETRAISGNSRQIGKKAPQKGLTRSSRK